MHQSKNIEAAKHELYDKAKGNHQFCPCSCRSVVDVTSPTLENYDLDSSGNLRPSPQVSGNGSVGKTAKKLVALQQSLHGREVRKLNMSRSSFNIHSRGAKFIS